MTHALQTKSNLNVPIMSHPISHADEIFGAWT